MIDYSREFQVLASHLNFTSAARELGVSQPALSRHIAELEQQLGFRLFDRSPVRLTTAGGNYLEGISQIISRIDELIEECRHLAALEGGRLTVSMIEANDTATLMVYGALSALRERYPSLEYEFVDSRQMTIEQAVLGGKADIGVVYCSPDEQPIVRLDAPLSDVAEDLSELVFDFMFDEPFAVWMHGDNPLAAREISFSDLSSCSVLLSANRALRTWADGMRYACERYGCSPTFRMKDANSVRDFLIGLRRDEAVFVSTSCDDYVRHVNPKLCRACMTNDEPVTYPVYLVYRRSYDNPMVELFVEEIKRAR